MFAFVLIPADDATPIQTKTASKAGGLTDDALVASARQYFTEQGGGAARAKALDDLSPPDRAALAKQLRERAGGNSSQNVSQLSDDALIRILRTSYESTSCEITALTVPTPGNGHLAVSMYGRDDATGQDLPVNRRATDLMVACGHTQPTCTDGGGGVETLAGAKGVRGDVFVGRCRDDEAADVWERVDFTVEDADPKSEWCRAARKPGGGGGRGAAGGAAPSLSGVMSQTLGGGAGAGGIPGLAASTTGGEEVDVGGYRWSQTDDEVELKFAVPKGTKAKYVKVNFGRRTLRLTVAGQTLVNGETGGDVVADECTYTLQDEQSANGNKTGRELCVTLGKADASTWPYPVSPKS